MHAFIAILAVFENGPAQLRKISILFNCFFKNSMDSNENTFESSECFLAILVINLLFLPATIGFIPRLTANSVIRIPVYPLAP